MRDIVILFGAGASFGAGGIVPERPPLGAHLFPELARLYPGSWGSLPPSIASDFGSHFEDGMSRVYHELPFAIPQLMREMAIYFAQFRIVDESSAYSRLLLSLERGEALGRTAFATLNYECTLDFEILRRGHQLNYFEAADAPRVPLWKLHGSCNMFSAGLKASQGIGYSTGVTFEGGVEAFLDIGRIIGHCLVETGLAPVMSLYMGGKPLSVSPSSIASVQAHWAATVNAARTIVVVGVRPWPSDEHVWGPLAETSARLLYVGDSRALEEWRSGRRVGPTEHLGGDFVSNVDHIVKRSITDGAH